jgi:hypothetical protein
MGVFGGEKYSKEEFDKAEQSRGEAISGLKATGEELAPDYKVLRDRYYGIEEQFTELMQMLREADLKMEKLLASGQKEAIGLNEEYERLKKRFNSACQDLYYFEASKLGIDRDRKDDEEIKKRNK